MFTFSLLTARYCTFCYFVI